MKDKKFAIYKFYAKWVRKDGKNDYSSVDIMFKEDPSEKELIEKLHNEFKKHLIEKYDMTEFIDIGYKYIEHESWCLHWFNHTTYNQFDNDSDVRRSFYNFIDRKKESNRKNGHGETEYDCENKNPFHCFMGAEDSWRWRICRCEHCQEQGKITIDH